MKRTSPGILFLLLTACWLAPAHAATPADVVDVDLAPLIDRSAKFSDRFAVSVPHAASAAVEGAWSGSGTTRTWVYQVRVPTAVSLSFHASQVRLPPSAKLSVTGQNATVTYDANEVRRGALWGRPLLGDTLTFVLSVSADESSAVLFEIASLQAGYRGLSRGAPDHPRYKQLNATANAAAACTQNYACNTTDANRGPGRATVALLIGNVSQCTGTLVNNTRADGRPFVLTARHCQNGELGGGGLNAASSVTIYWDSLTPCGQVLGSLYGSAIQAQSGATTRVEQQDTWLIELDQAPRIADPYFAGWNATGGVFTGGYSIHHALGNTKQYVTWNGQALLQRIAGSVLDAPYESDFWGVVNSLGNVGAGASGGALFDPDHRVVGTASLALVNNAGDGTCPATPPPAPNASNISAQYTALSAIWNSTRDASSRTGTTTLQTVLDPDATGRLTADGFGVQPITLTASNRSPRTDGPPVTLSWSVAWAQSCTATGGRTGDGWAGAKGASGSAQVMDYDGGSVQYTLTCTGSGASGRGSVQVDWNYIAPQIWFTGPSRPVMLGSAIELDWESNVSPCAGSDGAPGDGWAGAKGQSGPQMVTTMQTGATSYSLSCGSGRRVAAAQVTAQVVIPAVTLRADATRARVGTWVQLYWVSSADGGSCNAADGVPGWVLNNQNVQSTGGAQSTSDVPGTITYTINCTVGPYSSSSSVAVEFVDEPPSVTLTALFPTQEIRESGSPPATLIENLAWTSNLTFCFLSSRGPFGMGNKQVTLLGLYPAGTAAASEHIAGTYEYVLGCGGLEARTTIVWLATNPRVTLTTNESQTPGTWVAGRDYSIWSTTNTLPCATTGGAPGDGWAGATNVAPNYSRTVTAPRAPGTYTYTMTCGIGTASVGTKDLVITVAEPAVTLNVTPVSPAAGQYVTVAWNSTTSPCSANADSAGVSWGSLNMNDSASTINMQVTPGTYTYSITCGAGAYTATASRQVTFRSGPATEFTASATSVAVNTPVTLTWVAGTTIECGAIGGVLGDGWAGVKPVSGSATVTSSVPQTVNYGLNCNGGNGRIVSVTYTGVSTAAPSVPLPTVTLAASTATRTVGESTTLTWSSQNATACAASGGVAGDGWTGSLSLAGTMSVTRATPGATDYTVTCTGAIRVATAQTTVTFNAAAGPGSSSSGGASAGGGGGGGGALDRYLVLALLLAVWARWRRLSLRQSR